MNLIRRHLVVDSKNFSRSNVMNKLAIAFFGCTCLFANTITLAAGQSSANFTIPRDAINAGVGDMSSANFRLASSVGDAVAGGTISSVSFQLANGFRATVNVSPAMLNLLSVVSRKIHGSTPFELTIDHTVPITGAITVEPRVIGAGHTLVFHFDNTVNSVGLATVRDAMLNIAGNATATQSGNDAIVTLTNVADNKRVTVSVAGINGSGTEKASMGFLVGDVNSTRAVNLSDVSGVKARAGQAANLLNFQFDVNTSGTINASDIAAVKARSGLVIP